MFNKVIFQDGQIATEGDFNNLGNYPRETFDAIIKDLGGWPANRYAGFPVEQIAPNTVRVGAGRLYRPSGIAHSFDDAGGQTIDMLNYKPLLFNKIALIVVGGNELPTDIEAREFLINVNDGTTEGREVAVTSRRFASASAIYGEENATPVAPPVGAELVAVAQVLLTPSGIASITMLSANRVPSVYSNGLLIDQIGVQLAKVGPQLDTLRSDLSGLGSRLMTKADNSTMQNLLEEIIRLKDKVALPDDYASYGGDLFFDNDESDEAFAGYAARTFLGLRFPPDVNGGATTHIALANTIDPTLKVEGNMALPNYNPVVRLSVVNKDSEYPLTNTTTVTQELRQVTEARTSSYRVGSETVTYEIDKSGQHNALSLGYRGSEVRSGYESTSSWSYDYGSFGVSNLVSYTYPKYEQTTYYETRNEWVPITKNVTGSFMAQTFLNSQEGFICGFDLYFSKKASSGDVRVMICDVDANGKPLFDRMHEEKVITAADIKIWPEATPVNIKPMHARQGTQYAVVLASSAAHFVCQVANNKFAQGSLYYFENGEFVQNNANLDMAMQVKYAQFGVTRQVIGLQPLELSGGIDSIFINHDIAAPKGTSVSFEVRVDNVWRSLLEGVENVNLFATRPNLVQFRAVLTGTTDVMPAFGVGASRSEIRLTRPAASLTHISDPCIRVSSAQIEVRLTAQNWDAANHTLNCALLTGATFATVETPDATSSEVAPNQPGAIIKKFIFQLPAPVTEFRVRITGAIGASAKTFHVSERLDIEFP